MDRTAGYREIEHTADWELEVWAPSLVALLEQAARGMSNLMGTKLKKAPRITRIFDIENADPESLLVSFLGELLYLGETEGLGFDTFHLRLEDSRLLAEVEGASLESISKEVKAVTYHNLNIHTTENGLNARIVFDV